MGGRSAGKAAACRTARDRAHRLFRAQPPGLARARVPHEPAGAGAGSSYYASLFDTVEINNTFYRFPPPHDSGHWAPQPPPGFLFAVKVGQFGSHRMKLRDAVFVVAEPPRPHRASGPGAGPTLVQRPARAGLLLPLAWRGGARHAAAARPRPIRLRPPASLHVVPPCTFCSRPVQPVGWVLDAEHDRLRGPPQGVGVLTSLARGPDTLATYPLERRPAAPDVGRRELALFALSLAGLAVLRPGRPALAPADGARSPARGLVTSFSMSTATPTCPTTSAARFMRGFDTEAEPPVASARRVRRRVRHRPQHRRGTWAAHRTSGALPGIEVSAWRAHVLLLGDSVAVDRRRYNGSLEGLLALLRDSDSTFGALSVLSLPDTTRTTGVASIRCWTRGRTGSRSSTLRPRRTSSRGAIGIPWSRSPAGRTVSSSARATATAGARPAWSGTSCACPEERGSAVCTALIQGLRRGFGSSRIVERYHLRADADWPEWLTPIGVLWATWRGMNGALATAWLVWIWLLWGICRRYG